jgi:STE24 endopeptidase
MQQSTLFWVIIGIVLAEFALSRILTWLNQQKRKQPLPASLVGLYDAEKYQKFQEYSAAKERAGLLVDTLQLVVTLIMLAVGFAWLDTFARGFTQDPILLPLLFFALIALGSDLIGLPFEWYFTFVIEERFNKTTPAVFFADKLKGLALSAILGGGLLALFIWFYQAFPDTFWLYAWVLFMVFALVMTMFYTSVFVPLFNKLTPLPEGELRSAIQQYAEKVSFPLKNIMVIDGSKRSTKANAYFSGIGQSKTIVLYDTLIEKHTQDELVAILAHEVGHYKKKHTVQGLLISALNMFITLFLLGMFVNEPALSLALGVSEPSLHIGIIAFVILYSPLSLVTGLLFNIISRKNEFEADAFAVKTSSGKALADALRKLSVDSLSNLTPHPAYVFFHYSHPPLVKRLSAMEKEMAAA